jgi:ribosomal protein S21
MVVYVKRKDRETFGAMLRRFTRLLTASRVISGAKLRRFHAKPMNRRQRREQALRRLSIQKKLRKELF